MAKSERIVSYTADEIDEMLARGEDRSNWEAAAAMTEEELEAAIASDPDEADWDWSNAVWVKGLPDLPGLKQQLTIRIDEDVLEWFRATGKGYQTRMNAVLRQYVEHQKKAS